MDPLVTIGLLWIIEKQAKKNQPIGYFYAPFFKTVAFIFCVV